MAFSKQIVAPNGATSNYHKIINISASPKAPDKLNAHVASWPSYDSYLEEKPPIWNYYLELDIDSTALLATAQTTILAKPEFLGSSVIPDGGTDLEKAKVKQWTIVKINRDIKEFSGFVWDSSTFDSDPQSQSRIQGGVQLAQMAIQANQPFSITWTLKDNSARVLNPQDMINVGLALAAHVQAVHQIGRVIREQINAATTIEEVSLIAWPV